VSKRSEVDNFYWDRWADAQDAYRAVVAFMRVLVRLELCSE
jgi:hypothetical protein